MKISTKGRYGLIAIMDMAIFSKSDIVTLKVYQKDKIYQKDI